MKYSKCKFKYLVEENFFVQTPITPEEKINTWYVTLWPTGMMLVKKGFAWDGASGPTIDTKSTIQPSCEHDVFYKLMRKGLLNISWRPTIDIFLRSRLIKKGMWRFRAKKWRKWVGIGGKKAATKLPKIYEA